jgi:hypothetical protein
MSDSIQSVNLADDSQYVSLNVDTTRPEPHTTTTTTREAETTTAFVQQEKNLTEQQTGMMDSTPISDLMMEDAGPGGFMDQQQQPMLQQQPRMQSLQMQAPTQGGQMMMPQQEQQQVKPESKNFMNLTDDQLIALVAGVAASIAISKPVQDKLVTSVPNFLDNAGSRSMVGLAATGAVAAIVFYMAKSYVISR